MPENISFWFYTTLDIHVCDLHYLYLLNNSLIKFLKSHQHYILDCMLLGKEHIMKLTDL